MRAWAARRSAAHSMLFRSRFWPSRFWLYFLLAGSPGGICGRAAHVVTGGREIMEQDCGRTVFLRRCRRKARPPRCGIAANVRVGPGALIPAAHDAFLALGAVCASSALLAGLHYPIFAHWVWGRRWRGATGVNWGLGRGFLDAGGAGCIQAVAASRPGQSPAFWDPGGASRPMGGGRQPPGHNAVLFCWAVSWRSRWFGLNCAGSITVCRAARERWRGWPSDTILAAAMAALLAAAITRDASAADASLRQWMGGRPRAKQRACAFITRRRRPALIWTVAGALVTFSVEWWIYGWEWTTRQAPFRCHAIGGIWGCWRWAYSPASPAIQPVPRRNWRVLPPCSVLFCR